METEDEADVREKQAALAEARLDYDDAASRVSFLEEELRNAGVTDEVSR